MSSEFKAMLFIRTTELDLRSKGFFSYPFITPKKKNG